LTEEAGTSGRLSVLLESSVKKIEPASVAIDQNGTLINLPNDAVIVCAGGVLSTRCSRKSGSKSKPATAPAVSNRGTPH
jgi:thioredoxin reductase (NADPH)